MRDDFSELIKFSPYGGELILEEVEGTVNGNLNPENNVDTTVGQDRSMYSYIPKTGCPHAKQTSVLMVLRDNPSEESAKEVMKQYALDELAEKYHFILLFPNPTDKGWNYSQKENEDDDVAFLIRCFATLPKSKGKVAGFNGMIHYLGVSESGSAMAMTIASTSPLDAASIMVGKFPEGYVIPEGKQAEQVAWVYEANEEALTHLLKVNGPCKEEDGVCVQEKNPCVKVFYRKEELNVQMMDEAYDKMFSETRRWRNDVYGIYQPRIDFEKEGFVAHVADDSLHVNNDFKHTWYEFVPEQLRGTEEKVPLVFYFHGINCTGLYGAEQSGWHNIAKKENFIVVFPNPAIEERWNVWDDDRLPSDFSFVFALIEHMKQVHPIDESRIYISGFSMGSMMTNALACAYPDVFAAALANNGPNWGYQKTLDSSKEGMLMFNPRSIIKDLEVRNEEKSPTAKLADEKKANYDYLMPVVQCVGLNDPTGFNRKGAFPITNGEDNSWLATITYWLTYNHACLEEELLTTETKSGIKSSHEHAFEDRFLDQSYTNKERNDDLYHFVTLERMPHAVDLRGIEYGWNVIKHYRRNPDGSLVKE